MRYMKCQDVDMVVRLVVMASLCVGVVEYRPQRIRMDVHSRPDPAIDVGFSESVGPGA
jgi:hypothetical protein